MGPYCNYCHNRCFVRVPDNAPQIFLDDIGQRHGHLRVILATCPGGKHFERERHGYDIDDIRALAEWKSQLRTRHVQTGGPARELRQEI